jgi:two-component system chemotaxis response regulator CheY
MAERAGEKKRVLIVEDSPAMRQLLAITTARHGAAVSEAPDGLAALKVLAKERFDLIFVDLNMPVMDGLKLIQRVREDPVHAGTRIVVCSTEGAEETEKQARRLGADDYLRKPVSRKAVEAALAALERK